MNASNADRPAERRRSRGPQVIVVGAGAFGGWTALSLLRRGARVTLLDAWGAGHSRSSSGGETRLIRSMYNGDPVYTEMAATAFTEWQAAEAQWKRTLFFRTGILYMFEDDDGFARASLPLMRERGIEVRPLAVAEAEGRYSQIDFRGVRSVYLEPGAGFLLARAACELVRQTVQREGGTYAPAHVRPGPIESGLMSHVMLSDGRALKADAFVFACGPWIGDLFPDVVGDGIIATRQEVIFFGLPAGERRFNSPSMPAWINFGDRRMYGMPGNERRGLKVADDDVGAPIDPTMFERIASPEAIRHARDFVARRFPALASQPVVETRVCQYEYSPDGHFLLDRHPEATNVWLVGGGSGHGFKMGPALGAYVSRLVLDGRVPDEQFSYMHFAEGRKRVRHTAHRNLHP